MTTKISDESRIAIILNLNKGKSSKEISEIFNISKYQVHRIKKTYDVDGRTTSKKRGGSRGKKLTMDAINFILDEVDKDCSIRLKDLKTLVRGRFGIDVSESTISKEIIGFGYSFKRVGIIPERRNCEVVKETRRLYAVEICRIMAIGNKKIFYLDETGFCISMRSKYGRALLNDTPQKSTISLRSKNISVACCMSSDGVVYYESQERAYNRECFGQYLEALFIKITELNVTNALFIMDNVPFHKSQVIQNSFLAYGHDVMYLPPYSPFLNPIEEMFSKLKSIVRRVEPRNLQDLLEGIRNAHTRITANDCHGYFEHMKTFIQPSLDKENI